MLKAILLTLLPLTLTAHGAVLISEILFNEVGNDTTGEWIEIYNNGSVAVDLSDWKIGDEELLGASSDTEGMFRFPAGSSIGPGAVQIVAVAANRFNSVYGFLPNYEVGTGGDNAAVPNLTVYNTWDPDTAATNTINLANTNDHILLLNAADGIADTASWGNTFSFNPGLAQPVLDGQSYYRINPSTDSDAATDWAASPDTGTAATRSSPGAIPEPASGALLGVLGLLSVSRRRRSLR